MNKNRLIQLLSLGAILMLAACQAAGQPFNAVMSAGSGESIRGLHLATGAADAPPLWAFCEAAETETLVRTFDCRVPVSQSLAVGHLFLLADAALLNSHQADLTWELAIDNVVVDLESFGMFDYVVPGILASPSPVREASLRVTDWNLVLTNLNPGEHTLSFRAQSDAQSYLWQVNLLIEGESLENMGAAPFPLHS